MGRGRALFLGLSMKRALKRPASNPQSGTRASASNPSTAQPVVRSVADGPLLHFYLACGRLITHHKSDFPRTLRTKLECWAWAGEREAIILGVSYSSETNDSDAGANCGMAYLLSGELHGKDLRAQGGFGDLPSRYDPSLTNQCWRRITSICSEL